MSNEFGTSHYSGTYNGHLASDELDCLDFSDMVDWSSSVLDLLDEDLTAPEMHMKEPILAHANSSAETQNGYVSDLDISNVEADDSPPRQFCDDDTIDMNNPGTLATFTSLILFANNSLAEHIELKACDHTHQATIQALAKKLNLHSFSDSSATTVHVRKYSHEETIAGLEQQINSTLGERAGTVPVRIEGPMCGNTTGQPRHMNGANNLLSMHDPGLDQDFGKNGSPSFSSPDACVNDTKYSGFNKTSYLERTGYVPPPSSDVQPPILPRRFAPSSDRGSCLSTSTSVESHGWRESFPVLSRKMKVVGACWRCKMLRKKCDPNQPCKACPRAENKSRWQNIGCKRGDLLDHCRRVCLCSKIITIEGRQSGQTTTTSISESETSHRALVHLQDALDRLESILASTDDTYMNVVLDILCSPIVDLNAMPLFREHGLESNLLIIAWALIDCTSVKTILQVEHTDQTIGVMKAAATYEMEYGHSSIAELAIECLRNCVDILRLHEPGYLTPALHANCDPQQCRVASFQKLNSGIKAFLEEFSKVIFRKENRVNERKWWLSAFYGLYIQSYVRRTIVFVEDQLLAHLGGDHPELHRNCFDYLNLATELFEAASASYDPLMSAWSLEKEPIDHKFDVRLIKYYRIAQEALKTDVWIRDNVQSSFEFISLAFGKISNTTRDREIRPDPSQNLPLRPVRHRASIESQTRRLSSGITTESEVIYEDEGIQRVSSPTIDGSLLQKISRPRESSAAKRQASSPPQSDGSLRRNDSSSSMLNFTAMRRRGLSLATQNSPLSSPYLVAYDSTTSPKWNGSEDSLPNLPQLLSRDSPAPRVSQDFAGSMSLRTPSLHNKSSNESFLEMPRPLNRKRSRGSLRRSRISQQFFLCACCPKKPREFDSAEALSAHERERQFQCSYCGNRFKTKNEAERHQNSLHIRRQSWSCSELLEAGYAHTFRSSSARAGDNATCNYCGIEVSGTSGRDDGDSSADSIWDTRLRHLKVAHKFGECNTSKKFYRADHFRQHLKHSHAAVLGDGTSHLESICMKEVAPPVATANVI